MRPRPQVPAPVAASTPSPASPGIVAPALRQTAGSVDSTGKAPLLALLAGGAIVIGIISAVAFPAISAQSFYGSFDASLRMLIESIGDEDGAELWPFIVSGIGLAIAIMGVIGAVNGDWWADLALIVGPALALAVPGYLWHEIDKAASENQGDGSITDLGSGMMIFAILMILTILLALFCDRLEGRTNGN